MESRIPKCRGWLTLVKRIQGMAEKWMIFSSNSLLINPDLSFHKLNPGNPKIENIREKTEAPDSTDHATMRLL